MPKPSLRELFDAIPSNHIHAASYTFLKALIGEWEAQEVEKHMASLAYVHTTLAYAQAEIERLRPLAEVGLLVRGMRDDCYLVKRENLYHVARRDWAGYWQYVDNTESTSDPAVALRAIQKEET